MRLYYGTYGHHLSGKLYVYWGDDNLRTGQQVLAPVTHKRSGKTYNTMFTIARAQSNGNTQSEVDRLGGNGITVKTLGNRELLSLPGGKAFSSKAEWKRDSDKRYRNRFRLPEPEKRVKSVSDGQGAGSTGNSVNPAKGRKTRTISSKTQKRKKKSKTAKKAKKMLKKLGKTMKELKIEGAVAAKAGLAKNKTAADSFRQNGSADKIKQREAFTEE